MGPIGVGKTSLLKAMSGRHPRSGGTMTPDGVELTQGSPTARMGRKSSSCCPYGENLGAGYAYLPRKKRAMPEEIFELLPILSEMQNRRGGDLSGG